jgi:hypothetical protein
MADAAWAAEALTKSRAFAAARMRNGPRAWTMPRVQ